MKRYRLNENLLTERYVNLFDKNEISKYIDDIWDIMQESYKYLEGGFATASSKEDLIAKTSMAKLVRKNNKIVAVKLYKDQHGKKSIASGSDGTKEGKIAIMQMFKDDVKTNRSWAEVSGKAESVYLKLGAQPIPNIFVEKILGKKLESLDPDGYHYEREINGKIFKKILIGGVKGDFDKI